MKQLIKIKYLCLFLIIFILASITLAGTSQAARPQYVGGQIIVKYKESAVPSPVQKKIETLQEIKKITPASINKLHERFKVSKMERVFKRAPIGRVTRTLKDGRKKVMPDLSRIYKVSFPSEQDVQQVIEEYKKDPNVEYAEPNYIYSIFTPNDSYYNSSTQWGLYKIQLTPTENGDSGWNITTGNSNVVIAIVDTGVDYNHPDLNANMWVSSSGYHGYDFVDLDAATQLYYETILGYSFDPNEDYENRDNYPMDHHGHGTHCSGIASAVTNNSTGVAGAGWNCKIMALRAGFRIYSPDSGWGGLFQNVDCADAIYYAADMGADVISMSWGGSSTSSTIQNAVNYAYSAGSLLIAAAGNDNSSTVHYPAGYNHVVAVASTTSSDTRSSFSNYGSWVDVGAPGSSICSTYLNNSYAYMSGTSMACPLVAGLAGLVKSQYPSLTNDQIETRIKNNADDIGVSDIGAGRINAYKTLNTAPATPTSFGAIGGQTFISLFWNANSESDLAGYRIYRSTSLSGTYSLIASPGESATSYNDYIASEGTYYYKIKAIDAGGLESALSSAVSGVINHAPVTPTGLTAASGQNYIALSWNANTESDLAGYRIYRSTSLNGTYSLIYTAASSATSYNNTIASEGTYYYKISAYDSFGGESSQSSAVNARIDKTPPATPAGLNAVGGQTYITLSWTANSENDLASYKIYRSTSLSGTYSLITTRASTETSYNDSIATEGTYYYKISAVDQLNWESAQSAAVNARIDKTPPATPAGLNAVGGQTQVTLTWNANSESDLAGYRIYRSTSLSGTYSLIASPGESATSYNDYIASEGTYYYKIKAIDTAGLESALSSAVSGVINHAPVTPTGLTAASGQNYIALSWNANTESDLAGYRIYRSTSLNGTYSLIYTAASSATSYNNTIASEGTYYYKISAYDSFGGESSQSSAVNARIDKTPPATPAGLNALSGQTYITLSWTANSENDLASYKIYRSTSLSGTYSLITTRASTETSYNDSIATEGTYYYKISAVDQLNWESAQSTAVNARIDKTAPAIPTGLNAVGGQTQVTLTWNANSESDLAGYKIYRSTSLSGTYSLIHTAASTETSYANPSSDGTYYYKISAFDAIGLESSQSSAVNAVIDSTPPAVPTGLSATGGTVEAALSWNANSESDLAGYKIYRSTSLGGTYSLITTRAATETTYDDTLPAEGTYYYKISAFDIHALESNQSSAVSAVIDNTPPAVPTGFSAADGENYIALSWNANSENDLASYKIYRSTSLGGTYSLITTRASTETSYNDSIATEGTYYYKISAVDIHDLESSQSSSVSGIINKPPLVPTGLSATGGQTQISLSWNANTEADLAGYKIYRSPEEAGIYSLITSRSSTETSYNDIIAAEGTYYYKITAFDSSDLESSQSSSVNGIINKPPLVPTGLSATGGQTQISLSWNANTEADLAGYKIYKSTIEAGPYTLINTTAADATAYADIIAEEGIYYYKISAIDSGGLESILSSLVNGIINKPPATPSELSAADGQTQITLSWEANSETDLANYKIYRSTQAAGTYSLIDTIASTETTYADVIAAEGTYYYKISATDAGALESLLSSPVSAIIDKTAPAIPSGLAAANGQTQITLSWDANSEPDLAGYRIYKSNSEAGAYSLISTQGSTKTSYNDSIATEGRYYYKVSAFDHHNLESSQSSSVNAVIDHTPPAIPSELNASGGLTQAVISWEANSEADLAGYRIYRNTAPSGTYSLIGTLGSGETSYIDTPPGEGTYYYKISAFDEVDLESSLTGYVSAVIDSAPPAVPTGLSANGGQTQASLSWNANSESDLGGYRIYRSSQESGPYVLIDTLAAGAVNYNDIIAQEGTYYYKIKAFDTNNVESALSSAVSALIDKTAPAIPAGVTAEGGVNQIILSWQTNAESDLAGYKIYKSNSESGLYNPINSLSASAHTYTDYVSAEGTYYYKISAFDAQGLESGQSNPVSAVIDQTAPVTPTNVAVSDQAYANEVDITISWNDNRESDLTGYRVYRKIEPNDSYTLITTLGPAATSYVDTVTADGTYNYQISAFDDKGLESAPSAQVTAIIDRTPPNKPTINSVASPTNVSRLTLSGTKSADTVTILINGSSQEISYPDDTTWTRTTTLLAGENTFNIVARDFVGNESTGETITVTLQQLKYTSEATGTQISFPIDCAPTITRVDIEVYQEPEKLGPHPAGTRLVGEVINISSNVETFTEPLTITLAIPAGVINPAPYYWDDNTNSWSNAGLTIVSRTRGSITFTATHLTLFAIFDSSAAISGIEVYPNPFKLGSSEGIIFDGLTGDESIRIYTIAAELVIFHQLQGTTSWTWNARNAAGREVARGVYLYVITNSSGEKRIGKIAIIN